MGVALAARCDFESVGADHALAYPTFGAVATWGDTGCAQTSKVVLTGDSLRGAGVAQLVEQLIRNQQVVGSSPIAGSIEIKTLRPGEESPGRLFLQRNCNLRH